jgi:long-chain acyl-CoA synthetase
MDRAVVIDGQYNKTHSHKIYSLEKINKIGEDLLAQGDVSFLEVAKSGQSDDLATIIYTSGTTSDPKGVMLTNSNFMHNAINAPIAITINKDDNFLSVLPSWHVYERTVEYCALNVGASTAYSKPFKQVLLPDLVNEKPSVMVSVPRIWESLYKGILDNIKKGSNLQQRIFNWAIKIGEEYKEAEGILNGTWPLFDRPEYTPEELDQARRTVKRLGWKYRLADKIVFKKIRKLTGGRFRFAISGGGALNESIDKFFNAIGLIITEGYGLTETSPILAGRTKKDNIMFTVGPPIPEVEIKIVDKDNYEKELPNGQVGIVLVKGPMVMKGYYKNKEKTEKVIKDGWFNTERREY